MDDEERKTIRGVDEKEVRSIRSEYRFGVSIVRSLIAIHIEICCAPVGLQGRDKAQDITVEIAGAGARFLRDSDLKDSLRRSTQSGDEWKQAKHQLRLSKRNEHKNSLP